MNKIAKCLILLCLVLLWIPFCFTCGSVSTGTTILSNTQGEVLVKKTGSIEWVQAEANMVLDEGDTIKTESGAGAMVTFFNGSTIELRAGTQVDIRELVQGKKTRIILEQEIGETFSKVEKLIDSASRYEIETPAAIAAVRGSRLRVQVVADGTTEVQNIEGKISVTAQGVEITIPEGGTSTVKPGEPPGAISYSAFNDFRLGWENPNGVWSYGWMPVDFSKFNIYTKNDVSVFSNYSIRNLFMWYEGIGSDRTPCVWINIGDKAYGVPAGWLSLHPGPGQEPSVLRWTAPLSGNIRITGEFLAGDPGSMSVAIRHNSQEIWAATDAGVFDLPVNAATGDNIDFMVYGGYWSGNTPLKADITYER